MMTEFGKLLAETIGMNPGVLGGKELARVVRERMSICKLEDEEEYLARLRSSSQEKEALVEAVVIPETSFFRDKGPFAALDQHARDEWGSAWRSEPLRILSAPCSSGEEPYSIAMALMEAGLKPGEYEIDALDISRALLRKAERAAYTQYSFRGVPASLRSRYFESVGNQFVLKDQVRQGVRFIRGNLLDRHVLAGKLPYDVVFCRNLLIYLGAEARARVMSVIERLVARNGLLFVGHAETSCFLAARFAPLNPRGAFHFRKVEAGPAASQSSATTTSPSRVSVLPPVQIAPQSQVAPRGTEPPPREMPKPGSSIEAARQLADQGQLSEAAAMCERLLRENGANADAYCLLGVVLHGLEDLQRAEECFDRAIYLDERCHDAVVHLALIKEHKGDAAGAEVLWRRADRIQQQPRAL
ncbi:MAG: CheR family methyltransferase [Verrucomicrobiia bacterium]|jgi:chemotaxis protein methyltransferase WspC